MKPFSLEEYLKNPSKKLITRDERNARIICTDRLMEDFPICGLVDENGEEYYYSYTINGKHLIDSDDDADLFFAPEKKEGWVNVFKTDIDMFKSGRIYNSKTEAKESVVDEEKYVDTVKIEWEE